MPKFKTNFTAQMKKMKDQQQGGFPKDERIFICQTKDDGTARITMRFLPSIDVDVPYVKTHSHWFKGPGGRFIANCPKTLGNDCPVCEDNSKLWDEYEAEVRKRQSLKKTHYYSNVLIIDDEQTPTNNGKVFLLKYPKQIYDKIMEVVNRGQYPFHPEEGMNFYYVVKKNKVGKVYMPDYSNSYFSDAVTVVENIEKVAEQAHELAPFIDPKKFKSYDELKVRFETVMGETSPNQVQSTDVVKQQVQAQGDVQTTDVTKTVAESFNEEQVFDSKDDADFFSQMDIK